MPSLSRQKAKVLMYTKDPCPYCDSAKRLLNTKGIVYEEIDLTDSPAEIERIKNETGWRTFPIIVIDDKLVGGYSDLKVINDEGTLDKLMGI
ncbi:MAG: glutaredoxin [Bdellovibrio sp.]|nr:MAG: glutaredoxin [Bdellovibrio sp.]